MLVLFISPGSTYGHELLEHISDTIDHIRSIDMPAIITIMGDFNELNCNTLQSNLSMTQLVPFATRQNATLDKIFTNYPILYDEVAKLAPLGASDHCCIIVKPIAKLPKHKNIMVNSRPYRDSAIRPLGLLDVGLLIMIGMRPYLI